MPDTSPPISLDALQALISMMNLFADPKQLEAAAKDLLVKKQAADKAIIEAHTAKDEALRWGREMTRQARELAVGQENFNARVVALDNEKRTFNSMQEQQDLREQQLQQREKEQGQLQSALAARERRVQELERAHADRVGALEVAEEALKQKIEETKKFLHVA